MKKKKRKYNKKPSVQPRKSDVTTPQLPKPKEDVSEESKPKVDTSQIPIVTDINPKIHNSRPRSKKKSRRGDWQTFLREVRRFIDMLSPIEKSVIITLSFIICILVLMLRVQLKAKEAEIMLEMNFTPEVAQFDIPPEESKAEQGITEQTRITIKTYNEADRALKHADEPFKTLDEILAEREMKEASESLLTDKISDVVVTTDVGIEQNQQGVKREEVVNKNTLIKYALVDREVRGDLPNPVFTCEEEGKVVVDIKVNEEGKVVTASINREHSTTTNGCLVENALAYARQARFNVYLDRKMQSGTITYFFQSKR
ncbi:energy transducer TonB [Capnocytophaga canis]|uniref:energy transducer TonB family protein n=1 Tax=Capnocytophaga canis TaxID=1848903 RepID=UPI00370D8404